MIWIGLILGAIFGWAGLIAAACFWLIVAVAKLVYYAIVFTAQIAIATLVIIGQLLAWAYRALNRYGRKGGSEKSRERLLAALIFTCVATFAGAGPRL